MGMYKPVFVLTETSEGGRIKHNCDGSINFMAEDIVDHHTYRLLVLAIEEGKHQKAKEIVKALELK